jgi:hypothetical protein
LGTGGSAGTGGSGPQQDAGPRADASTGGTATFTQVAALIQANCTMNGCHHTGTGADVNKHVDLRASGLYGRLMMDVTGAGATAPEAMCTKTAKLIVPNSPSTSLVLGMVGTTASARMGCGARMPDNCKNNCLTAANIKTISDWVSAGAPNN